MTRHPSIRQRLLNALLHVSLAWVTMATVAVWVTSHLEVDERMDDALHESAEILFGVLSFEADKLPVHGGGSLPAPPHDERLIWQLVSERSEVVLRSHRAPLEPLLRSRTEGLADAPGGWRVYGMKFPSRNMMLYVAQNESERQEVQIESGLTMVAGAFLVGILCAVWLRRRVRQELKPLQELSLAMANYHPLEQGASLAPVSREELEPIRDAVLDLGGRLALRVDMERAFSAHAAHALRTPLAGMSAQLAAAMRESPPELQPRLQRARAASERLGRVVSALLTLFRRGVKPQLGTVDLEELVGSLPPHRLEVDVHCEHQGLLADADLLAAALLNIIDNSERHGANILAIRGASAGRPVRD